MSRNLSVSLLALALGFGFGLTRLTFADETAVDGKAATDPAAKNAESPADDGDDADDDAPEGKEGKSESSDDAENGKSADEEKSSSEKKEAKPPKAEAASPVEEPRGQRPGSSRDPRRGRPSGSEESKPVVADFLSAQKKPAADDKDSGPEPRVSFNFRFAPWSTVLPKFAEVAKLNLDMDIPPDGTFNYYDKSTYSVTEALDIINGYLVSKGFILIRRDKFLVVANFGRGPVPPNLIPTVPLSELPKRGKYEYVSVVIPLGNIDAKTAAEEIKDLLGPAPQGKAVPMGASNKLLVTDLASHLRIINDALTGMATVQKAGTTIRSFKLEHISATEAERMLRDLFSLAPRRRPHARNERAIRIAICRPPGRRKRPRGPRPRGTRRGAWRRRSRRRGVSRRGISRKQFARYWRAGLGGGDFPGGGDWRTMMQNFAAARGQRGSEGGDRDRETPATQRLTMTVDPRQNTLLITCSVEDMRLVEDAIKTIDIEVTEDPRGTFTRGENVPQLEVYSLENGDPSVVADVLYSTVPGLIIREDAKSRGIIVYGTRNEQAQVREIVKQLDNGGESITSLLLRHWDPAAAATSLKALFGNDKSDPPSIEADALGRRLMVRGTPDKVAQIKRLLTEMGEDGSIPAAPSSGGGPVRAITLPQGRTPAEVLALVESLFPSTDNNFIRIIRPSDLRDPLFQLRDVEQPRRGGAAQYRRPAQQFMPAGRAGDSEDAAPESDSDSGAVPDSDGGASRTKGKRTVAEARPFPLDLYRESNVFQAVSASRKDKVRAAPVAAARSERRGRPVKDELSEQLEEALHELDEAQEADGSQEASDDDEPETKTAPAPRKASVPSPSGELRMTVDGDRIIMTSSDLAALDRMEQLIQLLSASGPPKSKWTVYYLRVADATETAAMLGSLFPEGTVTRSASTNGSGLFGRGGMFSTQTSSTNDTAALSSLSKAGALKIIPELRSNALFISGDEHEVDQVIEALKVLDLDSSKDRVPRMIAVEHADVTEIAEIVRDVYKEHLDGAGQQGGNRGGGMNNNPMAMMFTGMNQQQPQGRGGRTVLLSIGVDTRTNHLVVAASDSLYRQVETLVKSLDQSAHQARRTVRVVSLQNSNSAVVQQTLGSLLGKTRTGNQSGTNRPGGFNNNGAPPNSNSNPGNNSSGYDPTAMFVQQRIMDRMMQGGGGGGGGFGNGGFGNGGFGGRGGGGGGQGGGGPGGGFGRGGGGGGQGGGFGRGGGGQGGGFGRGGGN